MPDRSRIRVTRRHFLAGAVVTAGALTTAAALMRCHQEGAHLAVPGDTQQALDAHPDWLPPRSDVRVFIGEPGAPEATKTTVEPGNTFSPGMRTFGVTWWLRAAGGAFFAPEKAPLDDLHWSYEDGYLPLIHCRAAFRGLEVQHRLFQDGNSLDRTEAVCAEIQVQNTAATAARVQLYLALRSLGPAGGPLTDLAVGDDGLSLCLAGRKLPLLAVDQAPAAIGCDVGDPAPLAKRGEAPRAKQAKDAAGWCFGLLRYDLQLAPGAAWAVHLDCPQQTFGSIQDGFAGQAKPRPAGYAARAQAHLEGWRARFGRVRVATPSPEFDHAFLAGAQHMLTATVGDQVRIAPLSYPLPWLRDGVYIIRALDQMGWHEQARAATEYVARNDFYGGFGAEGDAPGQGIWALVEHYRLTGDRDWLATTYAAIRRKCDWLFRMRRAERPIQVTTDTPVLSLMQAHRALGVICLAASDGVIAGTMDHGTLGSLGWVNHWALAGLRSAAYAARELGRDEDARRWEDEAAELRAALGDLYLRNPQQLEMDRTLNSLYWPTRAWEDEPERVRAGFDRWWAANRGEGAHFRPEPYWLYFEAGQAHNALRLGERERAWQVIEYRLAHQDLPGLYGWREGGNGVGMENALQGASLIRDLRGCQQFDSITPHGWSQAEIWLLQRALLVEEWQGQLLLFAGVPKEWLAAGQRIRFDNLPTWYGHVSAELDVSTGGRSARVTASGITAGTRIVLRLPGGDVAGAADEQGGFTAECVTCGP
jgi:hypothetical protein